MANGNLILMKVQNNKPGYVVGAKIQKLFLIISISSYLIGVGQTAYYSYIQLSDNHNLKGIFLFAIETFLFPLILFSTALLLRRKYGPIRIRIFESAFFTSIALVTQSMLFQLESIFSIQFLHFGGSSPYVLYELFPSVAVFILFVAALLRYQNTKA